MAVDLHRWVGDMRSAAEEPCKLEVAASAPYLVTGTWVVHLEDPCQADMA